MENIINASKVSLIPLKVIGTLFEIVIVLYWLISVLCQFYFDQGGVLSFFIQRCQKVSLQLRSKKRKFLENLRPLLEPIVLGIQL